MLEVVLVEVLVSLEQELLDVLCLDVLEVLRLLLAVLLQMAHFALECDLEALSLCTACCGHQLEALCIQLEVPSPELHPAWRATWVEAPRLAATQWHVAVQVGPALPAWALVDMLQIKATMLMTTMTTTTITMMVVMLMMVGGDDDDDRRPMQTR